VLSPNAGELEGQWVILADGAPPWPLTPEAFTTLRKAMERETEEGLRIRQAGYRAIEVFAPGRDEKIQRPTLDVQ
jgi:hypothetical protein